jgi:hypothetical protein
MKQLRFTDEQTFSFLTSWLIRVCPSNSFIVLAVLDSLLLTIGIPDLSV